MVNIFEINGQKKKNDNQNQTYTQSGGNLYGTNPYLTRNRANTNQADKLDQELISEGVKIEKLSDKDKRSYVNSLTDTEYSRLQQYKNAGYSFGASKALLDMEKQQAVGRGGYRGAGFQLAEPLGGLESGWNKANILGYLTEKIDNRVQNDLVPMMTVTEREKREQKLLNKYNNMTKADWDKVYQDFLNDPNAKRYEDDSLDYTLKRYWEDQNKGFWDKFWGAGLNFQEGEDGKVTNVSTQNLPSPAETIANAPGSALANATAVARGVTNVADNLAMLARLIGTKEGRDLLAYRYLDEEGRDEAIEKDPVGWVLDLFDFGALGTNLSSKAIRTVSMAERLAGATERANRTAKIANKLGKTSESMENIADMGISQGYNKVLNKALGRLSEGGKGANLIGDYISLTQRPLATLRAGANPKDEKGNYIGKTTGSWTINGVQNGINNVLNSMKNKIQTQATGLTPEVRERIRQNPFIREYRQRIEAMILDEGAPMDNQKIMEQPIEEVGQELLRRLEEYESRLQEDGAEYQILDKTTKPYNISSFLYGVYDVFARNGISLTPDGELNFRTTANPADMNPVKVAWNLIRAMEPNLQNMTIKQIREFRQQLRSLIKYQSDAPSTKYSKKVLRELVDGAFNKVVHKEIPGLAKVDELYTKRLNELREFKDGLVYQVGEKKGQIKDNFYSIISTLNTQNRQKMKARVEKLFPDLGARVEAIRMLPILAKTYQNSPQMMRALFQKAGFLGGITQSGGVKRAVMGWLLGIVADELFAKPMGEKRRKKAIDDLLNEVSPEALQKLAEIKSKVDAGIELSEQEKQDLATAMQEVAMAEYEYLDEQHKKEFDKIMESANNQQPKLPAPGVDTISPDGTIKLGMGNQLNSPETYKPKTREERVQEIQQEYEVEPERAEEMTNTIEDFLDEIGGDINGEINPREVNYEKFSTRTLNELMNDDLIPQSEKDKIGEILTRRDVNEAVKSETEADRDFAYRINKLQEEELRIGKIGKNKVNKTVADQQMRAWEKKKEKVIKEMEEYYGIDQFQAQDKYLELESKGDDYINEYKNSKRFQEDQAELQVLNQLKEQRKNQKKFIRDMDGETAQKRDQIVNQELKNGYRWETTDYGDRFINENGDKGIVKYGPDGKISVVLTPIGYMDSGITDILPPDTEVRFEGEADSIPLGEIGQSIYTDDEIPQFQTAGRANPNQRTVSAEEGLGMKDFRNGRTAQELADDYGLKVEIVDKIFTEEGAKALGRYKNQLIELAKSIKEGTAPHEVFHGVFDMVNKKRKNEILQLVQERKGMSEAEAKEWLAESFGDYFLTGKFDTKPIPKGFVNKVKWFFNKVKEFVDGTYRDRKKIQKLFDDILDNKIERDVQADMLGEFFQTEKGGSPLNSRKERSSGNPPKNRVNITDENASQYKSKLLDLKKRADDMDSQEFINELRGIFVSPEGSNYLLRNKDGEPYTLRISDHRGNADNYKNYKQYKNNISVSVEIIKRRFRSNDKVDLIDLKYEGKTLTNEQKQGMIDGVIDWIDKQEYTDTHYNDKKVSPKSKAEYQYQIEQKSLFDTGEPTNTEVGEFITKEYPKVHQKILPLAQKNNYTMEGFARRLDSAYNPDIETRRKILKEEEIDLTPEELVMITNELQKMVSDPQTERIVDKIQQGPIMAFKWLLNKMKENPLNVPEDLKGLAKIEKQQDFTALEKYMDGLSNSDKRMDTEILTSTYDPDTVEWMNNIKKKFVGEKDIKLNDLYKMQNLIEDHMNKRGTEVNENVIASPQLKVLLKDIEKMKIKNQNIRSFDRQVIEDSFNETEKLLENRMNDIKTAQNFMKFPEDMWSNKKFDKEQMEDELSDVQEEMSYELGATYDPDVDKWHANLKKAMRKVFNKYETFKKNRILEHVIAKHTLNTLGAKVNELSQYNRKQINEVTEGTITDMFYQGIEDAKAKQTAKKSEKATRKLVAISSMDVNNFEKQLKEPFNGKSPMPSIAITDPNVPHEGFGELTLVFGRDTVDPKVNPDNVIYGSDAWTPTFPDIDYRGGYNENFQQSEVMPLVESLVDRGADLTHSDVERLSDYIRREMNRLKDRPDFNGSAYQYAEQIVMDATDEAKLDWDANRDAFYDLIDQVSDLIENRGPEEAYIPARYFKGQIRYGNHKAITEVVNKVRDNLPEKGIQKLKDDGWKFNESDNKYVINKNYSDNPPKQGIERDLTDIIERINDRPNKSPREAGEEFVNLLVDEYGFEKQEATHISESIFGYLGGGDRPLTPENVLEAMKNMEETQRDTSPGSFRDMIGAEGTKIGDIEEVRTKNFAKTFHNTWLGDISNLESKYNSLIKIMEDYIADPDMINEIPEKVLKVAIKENYDPDVNKFKENIEEEGQFTDVPKDVLQRIIDVVEQGKKVPNRFSESKPRRIVDLYKEVQYVLVPNTDLKKVNERVKGTPLEGKVEGYQPDTHSSPRGRKMQELQKKYGNVFFSMGGVIMPIAMLMMMVGGDDEEGQQA